MKILILGGTVFVGRHLVETALARGHEVTLFNHRAAGGRARLVWASDDFLLDEGVAPWSEMPLWMPVKYERPAYFAANCEKAIADVLTFRPLAETAKDTLEWDYTRPPEQERRAGLRHERELQLLQAWSNQ